MKLPVEIELNILDFCRPLGVAVDPGKDEWAQTIKAFTTVCRATYAPAIHLLYTHCLYIDSSERLRRLLVALASQLDPNRHLSTTLPPIGNLLPRLQSLFLAPYASGIDDQPTAQWTFELFAILRDSLQRLVIDIPLRSLYPSDDHLDVRPKLRQAFSELNAVEEFTSVQDELYLATNELHHLGVALDGVSEPPVWARWSKLKHLALYNPDLTDWHYDYLPNLPNLECFVASRADKSEAISWPAFFVRFPQNPFKMLLVEDEVEVDDRSWSVAWSLINYHSSRDDPDGAKTFSGQVGQTVKAYAILTPRENSSNNVVLGDASAHVQQWIMSKALDETLWHYPIHSRRRQSSTKYD